MSTLIINEIESLLINLEELIKQILEVKTDSLLSEKELLEAKLELNLKKLKILKEPKHESYLCRYNKIQWSYYKQTNQTETAEYYENELIYLNESYAYVNEDSDSDTSIEVVSDVDELRPSDSFSKLIDHLCQQNIIRREIKTCLIFFNKLQLKLITNLTNFIQMIEEHKLLTIELENTINLNKHLESIPSLLVLVLNHLDDLKNTHLVSFIIHVQNSKEPELILFENTMSDKHLVDRQFRVLSLYFHPDKVGLADKDLAKNFFQLIRQCRDKLALKLTKDSDEEDMQCLIEHANEYFREAKKYRKESLRYLDHQYEYKRNQELTNHFSMLAYNQFKLACKLADKFENTIKQFELRKNMLLCFYISDRLLEAQLIGVSLIFLAQRNSKQISSKHKDEVKQLLDKINNSNLNLSKSEEVIIDKSLVDLSDLNELNEKISDELRRTLILSKIQNVRLDAPKTNLIKATSKKEWRVQKLAYDVGLVIGLFAIPGTILANLAGTLMGLYVIIDQRQKLVNKLTYLEKINKIIQSALEEYKKSNYLGFLTKLTEPYNLNEENQLSLFKIDSNRIEINPKSLTLTLLEHNFPPDGIGYLFNLIANALASGIRFKQLPYYRVQSIASDILDEISCKELEEKAIQLDKDISSLRRLIGNAKINFSLIKNYFFPIKQPEQEVADELLDESATKGSFVKRLGEIKLVAKINTAILSIINAGLGGIDSAKVYLDQIKFLINEQACFQYNEETKMRLELLELLFWSFTGQDVSSFENIIPLSIQSSDQIEENEISDQYLSYLENLIQKAITKKEKCDLLNKKGNRLIEKAELLEYDSNESFLYYKLAYKAYLSSFQLDCNINLAGIQILKCLVSLKQFREAIKVSTQLIDDPFYENDYQLWLYRGVSYRSINDFKSASHCLDESSKKQPTERIKKELVLVKKLENIQNFYYETEFFTLKKHEKGSNKYNILSLDSGGINGILPLIVLIEIEHRIKRPIAELFDLIVGSSFTSLIAFGLNFMNASTLLNLYCTKLNLAFQNKNYSILTRSKYKRNPSLFNDIIDSNQCLNDRYMSSDVLVPAMRHDHTVKIFSSFKAKQNENENFKINDVIWASSAISSFFEPFELDGVWYANCVSNPAKLAYIEAIYTHNIDFKTVHFLSLGTGCYLNDVNFNKNDHFKQDSEICSYIKNQIGTKKYQRLQFFIPEQIKYDQFNKINDFISYGRQFIEDNTELIDDLIQRIII